MSSTTRARLIAFGIVVALGFALYALEKRNESGIEESEQTLLQEYAQTEYEKDVRSVIGLRAGCGASNEGLRRPLYEFMRAAHKARKEAGTPTDIQAAKKYWSLMQDMEDAATPAEGPESPERDCERSYPLPEPPEGVEVLSDDEIAALEQELLTRTP
jgi:hypothetical protein